MNEREILSTAARLSAQRRRRVLATCTICGRWFEGTIRRHYCSAACKLRAQRRRRKAAEPARAPIASTLVPPIVAQLDALRAQSRPLDGCVATLIDEAREEQTAQW